jgi:hypothetical protein
MPGNKLTEEKLLAMLAASRKHREAAEAIDLDLCGGLTFERAYALSRDPSLMTEEERQLLVSNPRAARLIEHFKQAGHPVAVSRVEPPGVPDVPSTPTAEEPAIPAERRIEGT